MYNFRGENFSSSIFDFSHICVAALRRELSALLSRKGTWSNVKVNESNAAV